MKHRDESNLSVLTDITNDQPNQLNTSLNSNGSHGNYETMYAAAVAKLGSYLPAIHIRTFVLLLIIEPASNL